jgi:hypothetical protein
VGSVAVCAALAWDFTHKGASAARLLG